MLSTSGVEQQKSMLRELNRRGPQRALLTIADDLPAAELYGPLGRAIEILGEKALALARKWAQPRAHPLLWRSG